MPHQFTKHYTLSEAIRLLPKLRGWLDELSSLRASELEAEIILRQLLSKSDDIGGETVNHSLRNLTRMKAILSEFHRREIQIKDIDRGLIDFPAFYEDREVFFCWEKAELTVTHWHDIQAGFDGRRRI